MDGSRFDTLARSFSATGSRRRALAATIGAILGTFGLTHTHDAAAAKSGKCRRRPGECERCQRGTCEKKDGEKRCKAGKIKPKPFGTPCTSRDLPGGAVHRTGRLGGDAARGRPGWRSRRRYHGGTAAELVHSRVPPSADVYEHQPVSPRDTVCGMCDASRPALRSPVCQLTTVAPGETQDRRT